jgi:DNA (cytosine-5)-methyltransferase 1
VSRPRLLDLFCGAGGAAVGYHRAGFEVVGVDIASQPHYPFEFHQADAFAYPLAGYEVVHASPPCQAYASLGGHDGRHADLVPAIRCLLEASGLPWVIENIEGAPLRPDLRLCGSMFGLGVRRHRLFEANVFLWRQDCQHRGQRRIRAYYGKPGWLAWSLAGANLQRSGHLPLLRGSVDRAPADMGIDWMTWDELREAIPPAFTQYIGAQLLRLIRC